MTLPPTDEETQEIYKIYCQLATIIHDYAVGQQLYKKNCYSWAITANYYSLMHCGRFICLIGIKDCPKYHSDLHNFLSGKENKFERKSGKSVDDLLRNLQHIGDYTKLYNKIKILGLKLEKIKKIRENNSYDFFIISHQINHSILETEFPKAYAEIKKLNYEYLNFVFELFVSYINSLDYKDYFIGFLKDTNNKYTWAFIDLIKNLSIQNIEPQLIEEIKILIDEKLIRKLVGGISLDDSFFNPITYGFYPEKYDKMKEFINNINDLTGSRVV
ncbi:MAG: hypothetical protein O8C62_09660 [Candidatus Methanoperedens sp.]|nr:hypothetical protein [Candidatus Methanoperedens sp.]